MSISESGAFEVMVERLVRPVLEQAEDFTGTRRVSEQAIEAVLLALSSGFPLLTFPTLLQEKVRSARSPLRRNRARQRNSVLLAA